MRGNCPGGWLAAKVLMRAGGVTVLGSRCLASQGFVRECGPTVPVGGCPHKAPCGLEGWLSCVAVLVSKWLLAGMMGGCPGSAGLTGSMGGLGAHLSA